MARGITRPPHPLQRREILRSVSRIRHSTVADVHNRIQRSYNMSRIRSSGNATTELKLIGLLQNSGITGWRRNSTLPGRPDVVFPQRRLAIFVDGCFWHRCPRCQMIPTSNSGYWSMKFEMNTARDKQVTRDLRRKGWLVMRIWEHSLKRPSRILKRISRLLSTT